jgi:STE24 endopeptidase
MRILRLVLLLSCVAFFQPLAQGEPLNRDLPPGLQIPVAAQAGPNFDPDAATAAYLDLLSPAQREKSDAYFEGGYWLEFFGFLYGVGVAALLLFSGLSKRMRDLARKFFKRPFFVVAGYAALWTLASFALNLPWMSYSGFVREHAYGLATQNYPNWLSDQLKGLAISMVIAPLAIAGLYAAVRRSADAWWTRATVGLFCFAAFFGMLAPVFISPIFNKYQPLPEGEIKSAIFSLARANQIPTNKVVYFDASKQTTRISANVSGFLGTTQVSLNDNLMNKTSLPEIKAVMGHEMGHYVLNHSLRGIIYFTLLGGLGFYFVHRVLGAALKKYGAQFGIEDRTDPAGLPLAVAIFSIYAYFMTPFFNSITRQAEAEADNYGLNAAREPHGFAMAAMRLSSYRKIKPGYWEELFFYDHPSGYARVHGSMLWLKENQGHSADALTPSATTQAAPK